MEQDKNILIISQEAEQSTDEVLKYLLLNNVPFTRINDTDIVENVEISFDGQEKCVLKYKEAVIDLDNIQSVWYRRGKVNLKSINIEDKINKEDLDLYAQYYDFYKQEVDVALDFIYHKLKDVKHINSFLDNSLSKLIQLSEAQKCGLTVPKTFIANSKSKVLEKLEEDKLILKAMNFHVFTVKQKEQSYKCLANSSVLVSREDLAPKENQKDKVLLSLFQQYIEKKVELRVFYLFGRFFAMAIFSQQNEKTKVDFRHYDYENPNRVVPFNLPQDLKDNVNQLMSNLELNCGSLDFIYTPEGEYIFLEVNPIGQFDWVSKNCNFHIEKHIAKELQNEH